MSNKKQSELITEKEYIYIDVLKDYKPLYRRYLKGLGVFLVVADYLSQSNSFNIIWINSALTLNVLHIK